MLKNNIILKIEIDKSFLYLSKHITMSKTLVIVESPAKCKKIESYLGPGYKCIASFGHIRELNTKLGLSCIDIENDYTPLFIDSKSKYKQINTIKKELGNCDDILIATDDDREGEAIGWHICKVCKLNPKTTKRIIFHEITKTALQRAVQNPTILNMNTIESQKARQILDLLVGFSVSPILWKLIKSYGSGALSAGRCQTPALRLVYENDKECKENPGKQVYAITGTFTEKNLEFQLQNPIENKDVAEEFLEDSVNHDHIIGVDKARKVHKQPPTPFSTSMLQQTASSTLRMNPKQTMSSCQILYEAGLITYMRTDTNVFSDEFIRKTTTLINEKYGSDYVREDISRISLGGSGSKVKSTTNSKKKQQTSKSANNNAQEAHEAIRPTDITREFIAQKGKISVKEQKLYSLIYNHSLECCMAKAVARAVTVKITSPIDDNMYKTIGEYIEFPGWKIVRGYDTSREMFDFINENLRKEKDKIVNYNKIVAKVSLQGSKSHLSEANLVSVLEKKGIGRPSTFATLISKLFERKYVEMGNIEGKKVDATEFTLVDDTIEEQVVHKTMGGEKNRILMTPLGTMICEFLYKHFNSIFRYEYTKEMEDTLDEISKGKYTRVKLCDKVYKELQETISDIDVKQESTSSKYKVSDTLTYEMTKYGPAFVERSGVKGEKPKYHKAKALDKPSSIDNLENTWKNYLDNSAQGTELGVYKGHSILLKKGKFGLYIAYNSKNISCKSLKGKKITLQNAIELIESSSQSGILREIDENTSLRKGPRGNYIFYKTKSMKKPKFIGLKGFKKDPLMCELKLLKELVK
jgi:DNA topoisomerase-1